MPTHVTARLARFFLNSYLTCLQSPSKDECVRTLSDRVERCVLTAFSRCTCKSTGMCLHLAAVQSRSFCCSEMTLLRCRLGRAPQRVTASAKKRRALLLRDAFAYVCLLLGLLGFTLTSSHRDFLFGQKFCEQERPYKFVNAQQDMTAV